MGGDKQEQGRSISFNDLSKVASEAAKQEVEKDSLREARKERDTNYVAPMPQNVDEHIRWEELKIKRDDSKEERALRTKYAEKAFLFSSLWAIFICVLILIRGFGNQYGFFKLSETEFMVIIGALSATILAYFTFVMKYLFTRNNDEKNNP